LSGIATNFAKYDKNQQSVDITINQPLVEYVSNKKDYSNGHGDHLKGHVKVLYYNPNNTSEVIKEVVFDIESVTFCPEGIATFFHYSVNESGTIKDEYTNNKKTIVFDIGSGQINVAAFNGLRTVGVNTFEKAIFH